MQPIADRILANWRTTLAGAASFITGIAGIVSSVYFPNQAAPKSLLLASAIAAFVTNLLAKDK